MSIDFLTPEAVLLAVGALIPIVFLLDGERRADFVRFALGLGQPDARHRRLLLGSIVAVGALLGIAAAQRKPIPWRRRRQLTFPATARPSRLG